MKVLLLTLELYGGGGDKVTDPVEAYFATSEDLYEIVEYEVQA